MKQFTSIELEIIINLLLDKREKLASLFVKNMQIHEVGMLTQKVLQLDYMINLINKEIENFKGGK